jgi:hypothetical protein
MPSAMIAIEVISKTIGPRAGDDNGAHLAGEHHS